MKFLIIGQDSIGDHISNVLPLGRMLCESGHQVDAFFQNFEGYCLLRETPYFNNCIALDGRTEDIFVDIANVFPEYDRVYVPSAWDQEFFENYVDDRLLKNMVVMEKQFSFIPMMVFQPIARLEKMGLKYREGYIELQLNWYNQYYKDFQCGNSTVLLVTDSRGIHKGYYNDDLKGLLIKKGFDVRVPDVSVDIRTNLHLVNQVKYVLTVDTAILWMAKSLGKVPYVILHQDTMGFRRSWEGRLGCRNIIPWYDKMDDIPPDVIVDCFIESIKSRCVSFL